MLRLRGGLWMLLGMIRSVIEIGRSVVAFAIMFVVIGRVGIVSSELAIGIVRVVVLVTVPVSTTAASPAIILDVSPQESELTYSTSLTPSISEKSAERMLASMTFE